MTKVDITKTLAKHKTALLIMPSANYNSTVVDGAKKLSKKTVCYVTLNKTSESLKELFEKNKVNTENIVFVDAISKTIKSVPKQDEGVYFVDSPAALTEISLAVTKFLRHNFDYLIFDSITNLLVYQKKAPVAKFLSSIICKIQESNTRAVFYALGIDEQSELINETQMFVDEVIKTK